MKLKAKRHTCKRCGKVFWTLATNNESPVCHIMEQRNLCAVCAYWTYRLEVPREETQVIDGIYYDFLPPVKRLQVGEMIGGKGMKYIMLRDGSVKKSNDIWKIGTIPYIFRDEYPDTAWWIDKVTFNKINRTRAFVCHNKGCYDRYHCMRYDIRGEYDKGPWNIVPSRHIVGNEHCPSFINLRNIRHYDMLVDYNDMIEAVPQ